MRHGLDVELARDLVAERGERLQPRGVAAGDDRRRERLAHAQLGLRAGAVPELADRAHVGHRRQQAGGDARLVRLGIAGQVHRVRRVRAAAARDQVVPHLLGQERRDRRHDPQALHERVVQRARTPCGRPPRSAGASGARTSWRGRPRTPRPPASCSACRRRRALRGSRARARWRARSPSGRAGARSAGRDRPRSQRGSKPSGLALRTRKRYVFQSVSRRRATSLAGP